LKRSPSVAGQFYYGTASKLTQQVEQYIDKDAKKEKAIGIVSPHAGLVYSGPVAGAVFSSIVFPKTFVLIGPNHTGLGAQISLMESGEWEIPTGVLQIDEKISYKIAMNIPIVTKDAQAHMFEHSLEVQLPFITYFSKDIRIVPIVILSASVDECRILGNGIAEVLKGVNYPVVIVASTDMSHYVSDTVARKKDTKATDKILALDPEGLHEIILKEKITMCGYLPTITMLFAANALGAQSARLVKYSTSAEVSGDYEHVVGYAGIVIR
jgi:AmmeMemoRadiSam system protein B